MSLHDMMQQQEALQIESFGGVSPFDLGEKEKIDFIRWNVLALEDELHEFLGEIGWKPWASSRHINREAAAGELVDAMHFLMNLMLALGMDANEMYVKYLKKRQKNANRQAAGYDGVSEKCPGCGRALDDEAVECFMSPMEDGSKEWFCRDPSNILRTYGVIEA